MWLINGFGFGYGPLKLWVRVRVGAAALGDTELHPARHRRLRMFVKCVLCLDRV